MKNIFIISLLLFLFGCNKSYYFSTIPEVSKICYKAADCDSLIIYRMDILSDTTIIEGRQTVPMNFSRSNGSTKAVQSAFLVFLDTPYVVYFVLPSSGIDNVNISKPAGDSILTIVQYKNVRNRQGVIKKEEYHTYYIPLSKDKAKRYVNSNFKKSKFEDYYHYKGICNLDSISKGKMLITFDKGASKESERHTENKKNNVTFFLSSDMKQISPRASLLTGFDSFALKEINYTEEGGFSTGANVTRYLDSMYSVMPTFYRYYPKK
ncbi:MAG: hypothetical protein WAS72_06140 [Saprospiraceae bacterium]